ncbi:DUF4238 domain-containing protein [Leifsonia sp. NPDC056665]|uniref:DUF4238 domain-containing protein n=1 Tax=Leifsonia sp. NPDC056665 TaxID=3345901 RepID=UPI0036A5B8CD
MASELPSNLWAQAAQRANAMTAAGQEPRRHHLVPRFYLDRWADRGRVRVVDLWEGRRAFELSPERAAIETDFYRFEEPVDGVSPVFWEVWLSVVEERASLAFDRIEGEGLASMNSDDHEWLALFLAVQLVRSRTDRVLRRHMFVQELVTLRDFDGPENAVQALAASGSAYVPADAKQFDADIARFLADPVEVPLTREEDLRAMAHLATSIAPLLLTRHMAMYFTERAIITCDEPVVELHEYMGAPAFWSGVWGAPIFAFPFNPRAVLLLYRKDLRIPLEPGSTLTTSEGVDLASVVLANAYRYAFGRHGDRLAEKLFLPDSPVAVRSERFLVEDKSTTYRFQTVRRWHGKADAPVRPGGRVWPRNVPEAPQPTSEEKAAMEEWSRQ